MSFEFEKKIRNLVQHLESVVTNAGHSQTEPALYYYDDTGERTQKIYNVISCQVVNFGSKDNHESYYDVYNFCYELEKYEAALAAYFQDSNHKSIISIRRAHNDDGIWYTERNEVKIRAIGEKELAYHEPLPTLAYYENYDDNPEKGEKQWENWVDLIFGIYDEANSIFARNIRIPVSGDRNIYSGIYISFACKLNYRQIGIIDRICEALLHEVAFNDLIPDLYNKIRKQATRAVIAQIFCRNLSHSIGSHVLSRLIDTSAIKAFMDSTVRVTGDKPYHGFLLNEEPASDPVNLVAVFNSYMKSRMDYLADITTGVPAIENNKWLFKEILSGFDKNRLLLDRISGINSFFYQLKASFNGLPIQEELDGGQIKVVNDVMISLPNDILGAHAFYVILENIIRNCAKHGELGQKGNRADDRLTITIEVNDIAETNQEFYEVVIYDNNPVTDNDENNIGHAIIPGQEDCLPPPGSIVERIDRLVFEQNCRLNESVLNENGRLRPGSWGLIEMDASAAYLRKIAVEDIDEPRYELDLRQNKDGRTSRYPEQEQKAPQLNILKALAIKKDASYLGYRFFMAKPKDVLIIDELEAFNWLSDDQRGRFVREGIYLLRVTDDAIESKYDPTKIYNHKLVLIFSSQPDKILDANRTGLSKRTIPVKNIEEIASTIQYLKNGDPDNFKKFLWRDYIKKQGYSFLNDYHGLDFNTSLLKDLRLSGHSSQEANYYDHGKGYQQGSFCYKEIKYGAVLGFMPEADDDSTILQFIESVHNKILVMDERIQEYAQKSSYKPKDGAAIPISSIYRSTNILVPDSHECDLGTRSFNEEYVKILSYLQKHSDSKFCVVHLGIIEKMIESYNFVNGTKYNKETGVDSFIKEIICKPLGMDWNGIILISGRGTPHNVPPNYRYLNYSIVSQYMMDCRFKYLISEAVFSSRKINKI